MFHINLPISKYRDKIVEAVDKFQTTIIKGPTGCGKSTFVPIILSEYYKIAMVEPRRIAVLSLYDNIKKSCSSGYKIRFNRKNIDARVCIFTDGMFLKENGSFDLVIVDEIHERSIRMDMILSVIKKCFNTKESAFHQKAFQIKKLVLMSATVDVSRLKKYFNAKVLEICCPTFPLTVAYEDRPVEDYVLASFLKIKEIIRDSEFDLELKHDGVLVSMPKEKKYLNSKESNDACSTKKLHKGDILVFLPGEEDINDLYKLIKGMLNIMPYKIYSSLSDQCQKSIFLPSTLRKVILSTNICETSITIPGISFVIDCGLYKTKICRPIEFVEDTPARVKKDNAEAEILSNCYSVNMIGILPISKESAKQRAGRSNRMCAGKVYRLYTKDSYDDLKNSMPEIKTKDLKTFILYIISKNIDIFELDLVDLPERKTFKSAMIFLLEMKFIEVLSEKSAKSDLSDDIDEIFDYVQNKDARKIQENTPTNKLNPSKEPQRNVFEIRATDLGYRILSYPFDVNLSYFFYLCCLNGLQDTGAMLVSLFSLDNYDFLPKTNSDNIKELLDIFKSYIQGSDRSNKGLDKANRIYKQLRADNKCSEGNIEKVFSKSFEYNLSIRQPNRTYTHKKSGISFYARSNEKKIVFIELIAFNKIYSRIVGKYYPN